MPIKPIGSTLSLGGNTLYVSDISKSIDMLRFQRPEYDHDKLLNARHEDGTKSTTLERIGGGRVQIGFGCGLGDTPKPLTGNDTLPNNINDIYKRLEVIRYTITGDVSTAATVDAVQATALVHRRAWAKFEARQEIANGYVTYEYLTETLQLESFSYLTTTSFNISGENLTASNLLIREFSSEIAYSVPQSGGSFTIYKSWRGVFESIVIAAAYS